MKLLLMTLTVGLSLYGVVCPPVNPNPVEGDSPEEDPALGLEYDRYLREVVQALEEDEAFRKKLEETNMTEIKNGKIARHLDLVSHQIRERLDEIKRQEIQRLRELAREKMKKMNGIEKMDKYFPHHIDVKNPHSFEMKDLESLIKKATNDLDELDKKRRNEFKTYEMEKEHERREEMKNLDEEHRKQKEKEYEEMQKKHQDHPKVHHPGSKAQLEQVWEESDHMDPEDFNPKTFFQMHDMNGDGFLDQDEVEALFQKELDQVYDPNLPEDDMRERYEDMARMREHVFGEVDQDKDKMISFYEFINYTNTAEFEKDEGWKTVDEEQNFTDEEYERYEQMLREHEEKMKQQGYDPNLHQPGVVPLGHDPSVQEMQIPHDNQAGMQPGMHQQPNLQQPPHIQQQQQQFQQQQFQQPPQMNMPQGQVPVQPIHQGVPVQGQIPQQQVPIHQQMPQGQVPIQQQQLQGNVPIQGQPVQGQGQPVQGQPPLKFEGQQGQQQQQKPMV